MPLYKLIVAYDGSRFNGFQRQVSNETMMTERGTNQSQSNTTKRPPKRPHWDYDSGKRKGVAVTVQECLEDALLGYNSMASISVQELALRFAGRTDKGVHARGQVIAVHLTPPAGDTLEQMKNGINSRLPVDISVEEIESCPDNDTFDPRKDVVCKVYSYTIKYRRKLSPTDPSASINNNLGPHSIRSATDPPCLWVCPWALCDDQLPDLCRNLQGNHNYQVFVHKKEREARSHIMTVDRVNLEQNEIKGIVIARLEFEAKGFRRSMIRNLVGFIVDVGRGLVSVESLGGWDAIWSGNEDVAARINAAPSCGLCLDKVGYLNS